MTNGENKNHLTGFENQEIDGKNVIGGGTGDIGLTEDFSNLSGMVADSEIMDVKPLGQDPIGGVGTPIVVDGPITDFSTTTHFDGTLGPNPTNT